MTIYDTNTKQTDNGTERSMKDQRIGDSSKDKRHCTLLSDWFR